MTLRVRARLRRSLKLRDVLLYGIVMVSPVAPMPIFGLLSERGHGHVVTAILIALVAMLFTSISYGRMAHAYPSAGSAFTYVAEEIHPVLGYITGWAMIMDYLLAPLGNTIWAAQQSMELLPSVPAYAWKIIFACAFTFVNLQGIRSSARINAGLTIGMLAVVAAVLIAAAHFIVAHAASSDAAFFTRPFYDPSTFSFHALFSCTAITILTYIGFDGISTLSEECENPRRNMLLAPVLTCVIIGILSAVEVYVAQLAWPASQPFPDVDTAYAWVAGRMWGPLFSVVGVTLIVAILASGMAAHLGAARLLYGMGRSNALPRRFFGAVEPTHGIPRNNVILVGVIILVGAFVLTFEQTVELLNFGALTAFMGVNAAAFVRYFLRAPTKTALNCVSPVLGFAVCLFLWWNLGLLTKAVGLAWMAVGLLCGALMTGGFRNRLKLEFPDD